MAEIKDSRVRIQVTDGALIPDRHNKAVFSSWRIAFWGALLLLVLLPVFGIPQVEAFFLGLWNGWFPSQENLDRLAWLASPKAENIWWKVLAFLPEGIWVTFQVTLWSILLATGIGLIAGLGQISRNTFINRLATVYVEVIRGVPLLVQIFIIYFVLSKFIRLEFTFPFFNFASQTQWVLLPPIENITVKFLDDFSSAVLAMAVCYGAYLGEIFRAGIQAIPKGQMEAALALGLTRSQAISKIVLPQTVKIVLPAIGNEFIALLKDSSMVSVLALSDILRLAKNFGSKHGDYFPPLIAVALIYLVLTLFLSRVIGLLEERYNKNAH